MKGMYVWMVGTVNEESEAGSEKPEALEGP